MPTSKKLANAFDATATWAVIECRRCLEAQRDPIVADDIDAHEWVLLIDAAAAPPSPHSRSLRNDNVYVFNRGPSQASAFLQQAFLLTGAGPRHVDCRKGSE